MRYIFIFLFILTNGNFSFAEEKTSEISTGKFAIIKGEQFAMCKKMLSVLNAPENANYNIERDSGEFEIPERFPITTPKWKDLPKEEIGKYMYGHRLEQAQDASEFQITRINIDNNWRESGGEDVVRYKLGTRRICTVGYDDSEHLIRLRYVPSCNVILEFKPEKPVLVVSDSHFGTPPDPKYGVPTYITTIYHYSRDTLVLISPYVRLLRDVDDDYHYDLTLGSLCKFKAKSDIKEGK